MSVTARSPAARVRAKDQAQHSSKHSLRALDWLNFFLADVQTGVGPFLAIYLAGYAWDEERIGLALSVGGIAGILAQTPAGALVDQVHQKRTVIAVASPRHYRRGFREARFLHERVANLQGRYRPETSRRATPRRATCRKSPCFLSAFLICSILIRRVRSDIALCKISA